MLPIMLACIEHDDLHAPCPHQQRQRASDRAAGLGRGIPADDDGAAGDDHRAIALGYDQQGAGAVQREIGWQACRPDERPVAQIALARDDQIAVQRLQYQRIGRAAVLKARFVRGDAQLAAALIEADQLFPRRVAQGFVIDRRGRRQRDRPVDQVIELRPAAGDRSYQMGLSVAGERRCHLQAPFETGKLVGIHQDGLVHGGLQKRLTIPVSALFVRSAN